MADAPLRRSALGSSPPDSAAGTGGRPRLTVRRLFGLDRSGPPPEQTLAGQPLHPWTIPNAIGFARLALIPVFLLLAYRTADGRSTPAALLFAALACSDYADGIVARLTGQYSRLGTLLDPVVDRVLVVAGLAVCWSYELLPRWALLTLAARELLMLVLGRIALALELEIRVNWPGRIGVWWTMSAPFWAMLGVTPLAELSLYVGLLLVLVATALYVFSGIAELHARRSRAPSSST